MRNAAPMAWMNGAYGRFLDALGVAAGAVFAAVALATTFDVLRRDVSGSTVKGLGDLVEYALFVTTFLAAPWLLRQGGHVQVDFLVTELPQRAARLARRVGDTVGLAVCVVLFVSAVRVTWRSWASGSIVLKTVVFPEWWLYAVIVVSMLLLALEFVRRLIVGQGAAPAPADL
ncbi:MAG: TRAP transporter small permease [Pseudomonadota bacterium]|nr:TRAP transporter small permease [Pseudomonadota bacterium]